MNRVNGGERAASHNFARGEIARHGHDGALNPPLAGIGGVERQATIPALVAPHICDLLDTLPSSKVSDVLRSVAGAFDAHDAAERTFGIAFASKAPIQPDGPEGQHDRAKVHNILHEPPQHDTT